jgi:hypothetical protein
MCLPVKPYKVEREWKHLGLSCAVVQNRQAQTRCGYVRVPPGHPAYGKDYNDLDVDVHGGLTFAALEPCTEHEDGQGYWLGFDCAHSGDDMCDPDADMESLPNDVKRLIEIHRSFRLREVEHYWTEPEVASECERLAEQLVEMVSPKI